MSDTFTCFFCQETSDELLCSDGIEHCPDCRVECSICWSDMEYDAADERAIEDWKEGRY